MLITDCPHEIVFIMEGDSENVWKEVIGMEDSITPNTVALEMHFGKKVPSALGFLHHKTVNISNPVIFEEKIVMNKFIYSNGL